MNTVPGDYRMLREGLARLPEFPVPDGLWPRILARRAAATRSHWWTRSAVAAALLVILGGGVVANRSGFIGHHPASPLTGAQAESQALEARWRELGAGDSTRGPAMARLGTIDAALQSAYDRGATPDELAPLWKQRNVLLRTLIAASQGTGATTRI